MGEIIMIIIISITALMAAITLTACFKPGKAENIVNYEHTEHDDETKGQA
jgi:hypothetical protein